MLKRFGKFIFACAKSVFEQDFMGLSAEMAFYTIFSFFPFMIFIVSIFKLFGAERFISYIFSFMAPIVPLYVHQYIASRLSFFVTSENNGILTITFFISMIIASNAMFAMIKGLNRAYHTEETRPLWLTRLLSVAFVFLQTLVIFIGTNAIIFGKFIISFIASLRIMPAFTLSLISFFRWPAIFLAFYMVFFTNYYFMPNVKGTKRAKFFAAIPGTFFFCITWIVSSWLYSIYLNHINMYSTFFGTMGALATFLIWLYYTSLILLLGGEINSRFYNKFKDQKKPWKTVI